MPRRSSARAPFEGAQFPTPARGLRASLTLRAHATDALGREARAARLLREPCESRQLCFRQRLAVDAGDTEHDHVSPAGERLHDSARITRTAKPYALVNDDLSLERDELREVFSSAIAEGRTTYEAAATACGCSAMPLRSWASGRARDGKRTFKPLATAYRELLSRFLAERLPSAS